MNRYKSTGSTEAGRKGIVLPADGGAEQTGIAGYDIDSYQEIKRQMAAEPCLSREASEDDSSRTPKAPRQLPQP